MVLWILGTSSKDFAYNLRLLYCASCIWSSSMQACLYSINKFPNKIVKGNQSFLLQWTLLGNCVMFFVNLWYAWITLFLMLTSWCKVYDQINNTDVGSCILFYIGPILGIRTTVCRNLLRQYSGIILKYILKYIILDTLGLCSLWRTTQAG